MSTPTSDPKKLPVRWNPRTHSDLDHQSREWSSGTRGGGIVPPTFTWPTNPKQNQEECGSGEIKKTDGR